MKIKFVVDKRTEVMEVLQKISSYFMRYPRLNVSFNLPYIKDVENYFSKYKNHKAVKLLEKVFTKLSFNYDAPMALVLQMNEDFTYDVNKLKGYPFEDRLNKDKMVLEFLNEIKNFVEDTNFMEFYNNHKKQYNIWLSDVKNVVGDGLMDYLNTFFKENIKKQYIINLMPMQTRANYGVLVGNKSICNLGIKLGKGKDMGKYWFLTKHGAVDLLHHEFSHPIINPLTDKYFDYNKFPKLPKEIKKVLLEQAYGEDVSYINEQIIRASDILYCKEVWGRQIKIKKEIKREEENGFVHTKRMLKALKKYQKQTEPMRTYFPKILEEFYKPLTEKDYDLTLYKK